MRSKVATSADNPQVGEAYETLGLVQLQMHAPEAAASLVQAVVVGEKAHPPAELYVARLHRELAEALAQSERPAEAQNELSKSLEALRRLRGDNDSETRRTARRLIDLYVASGDTVHADALRELAQPVLGE